MVNAEYAIRHLDSTLEGEGLDALGGYKLSLVDDAPSGLCAMYR